MSSFFKVTRNDSAGTLSQHTRSGACGPLPVAHMCRYVRGVFRAYESERMTAFTHATMMKIPMIVSRIPAEPESKQARLAFSA